MTTINVHEAEGEVLDQLAAPQGAVSEQSEREEEK